MSSSPWEWLWNGDEDVATPFHPGAVSRCAPVGRYGAAVRLQRDGFGPESAH
jgi:hypothetical protein